MSRTYTTMSREGYTYLCSIIKQVVSLPTDVIDNYNLATNTTYSSTKIKSIVDQTLIEAKDYASELCSALVKLECRKTTTQPTLENSDINIIYLYSADGNAPFQQYLKISETELIDMGSTNISLDEYLTTVQAAATYVTQTDFNVVTSEVNTIKNTMVTKDKFDEVIGTEIMNVDSTTVKGAINELDSEKLDINQGASLADTLLKVGSDGLITTIPSIESFSMNTVFVADGTNFKLPNYSSAIRYRINVINQRFAFGYVSFITAKSFDTSKVVTAAGIHSTWKYKMYDSGEDFTLMGDYYSYLGCSYYNSLIIPTELFLMYNSSGIDGTDSTGNLRVRIPTELLNIDAGRSIGCMIMFPVIPR